MKEINDSSKIAEKKKPRGKPFEKGKSGNPRGKKPLPENLKIIRNGSKPQLIEAYGKYSNIPFADLQKYPPTSLIEHGVLKCLAEFANSGDTINISKLWEHIHGKPNISVDMTTQGEKVEGKVVVIKIPDNGRD